MESILISAEQLKTLTSISNTLDVDLLQPHLLISQQLYVQPVLGDALYNDIVNRYDNNTITGDTLVLYDEYIVPAIAYSAWFSAAPFLAYKTNRSGIQTQGSPDNVAVNPEELSLYIARVEHLMNFYNSRMQKYLDDNYTKFPLYRSADSQEVSKGGGIYLGYKSLRGCNNDNYGWQ